MRCARLLIIPSLLLLGLGEACQQATVPGPPDTSSTPSWSDGIGGLDALNAENLTYWDNIEPLIAAHCLPCHGDNQAIEPLLGGLEAVRAHASAFEQVLGEGTMPPWHVDEACSTYANSPKMTGADRAMALTWVAAGMAEGQRRETSTPARQTSESGLSGATIELVMSAPYSPAPDTRETRCVPVPWAPETARFITGLHVTPGQRSAVRSVRVFAAASARGTQLQQLDDTSFETGYACPGPPVWPIASGDTVGTEMADDVRWIATWLAGDGTLRMPESAGVLVRPEAIMILQIDYDTRAGEAGPDLTRVEVEVAESVPFPIVMVPLTDLAWLNGQGLALIPPDDSDVTFSVSREVSNQILPFYGARAGLDPESTAQVHGVFPVMGSRGTRSAVWVQRASEVTCLADVVDYDPRWQRHYVLAEPVTLNQGDTLNLSCSYQGSAAEGTVALGPGPTDERCMAFIALSNSVAGSSPSLCDPNCAGRDCGPNGCGGSCGECPAPFNCDTTGMCVAPCSPACTGKMCGDDGCGGVCGVCGEDTPNCTPEGTCTGACVPDCAERECGDDGCGGLCGVCPDTAPHCDSQGECQDLCIGDCDGKACGDDGCGQSCGTCPEETPSCTTQGQCAPCLPDCAGRECGDDGCGGLCGDCPVIKPNCTAEGMCTNLCIPSCEGKVCGADGCGGNCGSCPVNAPFCTEGECFAANGCSPNCDGKECGADGCGGNCGLCPNTSPQCVQGVCGGICVADCQGKQCGDNGCGGVCGLCPDWAPMCEDGWCTCTPSCIGKMCGSDGCTGSCGNCPSGSSCVDNTCVLD